MRILILMIGTSNDNPSLVPRIFRTSNVSYLESQSKLILMIAIVGSSNNGTLSDHEILNTSNIMMKEDFHNRARISYGMNSNFMKTGYWFTFLRSFPDYYDLCLVLVLCWSALGLTIACHIYIVKTLRLMKNCKSTVSKPVHILHRIFRNLEKLVVNLN